jgi:Ser/Thr protein kinase RdoA (MazF antagonist)
MPPNPLAVLRTHWFPGLPALHVGPTLGGGFSGSTVVAVRDPLGRALVLKSFSTGTTPTRAAFVHRLMTHLADRGLVFVPRLVPTVDAPRRREPPSGQPSSDAPRTVATDDAGVLWELATHMPGSATTHPTLPHALAAMTTLASLHIAAERLPDHPPTIAPAPAHERRITAARRIVASPWHRLLTEESEETADRSAGHSRGGPGPYSPLSPNGPLGTTDPLSAAVAARLAAVAPRLATPRVTRWLEAVATSQAVAVPLIPVIRDLRADHVLFTTGAGNSPDPHHLSDAATGPAVSGVVDFHAAAIDTPATDLARLLGDWESAEGCGACGGFLAEWGAATERYQATRRLSQKELGLIPWLAATGVVFGLDQWFRWILVEGRRFADAEEVVRRIDRLVERVGPALEWLEGRPAPV